MTNTTDFNDAGAAAENSEDVVNTFLNKHVEAIKQRLSRDDAKVDERIFAIFTDRQGTIENGQNSEELSAFLVDAFKAGIPVHVFTGVFIPLNQMPHHPLASEILQKDPKADMLERELIYTQIEEKENCFGMLFDDNELARSIFIARGEVLGTTVTVLDPNDVAVEQFLNNWVFLSADSKAKALAPWLELKSFHTQPKPAPGAEPA